MYSEKNTPKSLTFYEENTVLIQPISVMYSEHLPHCDVIKP